MNFTLGIIIAVGSLVAFSLVMISMDPGYLATPPASSSKIAESIPVPEGVSEVVSEVTSEVTSEMVPEVTSEMVSEVTSEMVPEVTSEVIPEVAPEIIASIVKVSIPQNASSPGCETTNECYLPYQIQINVGDTLVWINNDVAAHTVTSGNPSEANGIFNSEMLMPNKTFEYTFTNSGEYDYYCMVHPWMIGKVSVN
ncbi:MAG: plastocyanin/azurin family copper-binding protein [Nitrosarchaeum sp.]